MSPLKADALLLVTSLIWGFAFVAQRAGMEHLGPFAFNSARFILGAAALLPLRAVLRRRNRQELPETRTEPSRVLRGVWAIAGPALAGAVLFMGASLQQMGLIWTTAGNAGFITSLYVVIVPILGMLFGKPTGMRTWIGAILAVSGLFILSVGTDFRMAPGDAFELIGAFFWAFHILIVARLTGRMEPLDLAIGQFTTCALLSTATAILFEPTPFAGVLTTTIPLLYAGLLSTGAAYTLQIIAQRFAHPARASIIFSMESLFAAMGGVIILGEAVTHRLAIGGTLMLTGMIAAQLDPPVKTAGEKAGA